VSNLQSSLEMYKNWAIESQTNDIYKHITDEERSKVNAVCDEVSAWMYEKLDEQGSLQPNENPVLTIADLHGKVRTLKEKCGPIMHKPVPKKTEIPQSKEEPKKEEPKTEEDKADSEPMEGVEVEADEAKKADAMDVE